MGFSSAVAEPNKLGESALSGERGTVVLLHGLIRTSASMNRMAGKLRAAGYATCNLGYPSTDYPLAELAANFVLPAIQRCIAELPAAQRDRPLNFVTHSMGGIIVRQLVATGALVAINRDDSGRKSSDRPALARVVMLGPPNTGSELVDRLGKLWLFRKMNGPAGEQLITGENGFIATLGSASFELGIIAGTRSYSLLSKLIPGDDDGKVGVARAKLDGMSDFITLPVTHTFMMRNRAVISQTLEFLQNGRFALSAGAETGGEAGYLEHSGR